MSDDLPKGWATVSFGLLLREAQNGCSARSGHGTPTVVLRLADVSIGGIVETDGLRRIPLSPDQREKYALKTGDLLAFRVNGSPSIVGQVIHYDGPVGYAYCDHFIRFRVDNRLIEPTFAELAFRAQHVRQDVAGRMVSSAGQNTVSQASLREILLPLPPIPEQRRIVAKVEELLAEVNAARARLAKVSAILKQFRQSVLAAACSGRLTEEWTRHEESWPLVVLDELIQDGPQNGLYKPQSAYGSGAPIVRIDDFRDGVLRPWNELKHVRVDSVELTRFGLKGHDLLINRVNSIKFLGKSVLVPANGPLAVFESNMMKCSLDRSRANPRYVLLFLSCPAGRTELKKNAKHAVNQASINQQDVREMRVPLPSLAEQDEIVRVVDGIFAATDPLAKSVSAASARATRVSQSILAKAFRGELVPTEAELAVAEGRDFESAEQLLARVRAATDNITMLKTPRRSAAPKGERPRRKRA